jgi:tRNA pseudouridine55 synthase
VDGVLVVDKPAGPTSHDIVDRVRRSLGTRRVGHTGTLDPFATGVLPVCVGKATRLARFFSDAEKVYEARVRLGFATTTDDLAGEPLSPRREVALAAAQVEAVVAEFVGTFDQVPPAFSARRVGGRRLYELARRGEATAREARPVSVRSIEVRAFAGDELDLRVDCSAGTYVRALARDIGERLGVGGHLTALRRTRAGAFDLSAAVSGDDLADAASRILPLSALLTELPGVTLGEAGRALVRHGREVSRTAVLSAFPSASVARVRLLGESGELLGLAVPVGGVSTDPRLVSEPFLHPEIVLID